MRRAVVGGLAGIGLLAAGAAAAAPVMVLQATGSGSCAESSGLAPNGFGPYCINADPNVLAGTYSSNSSVLVRNWFAFDLSAVERPVASASLRVWNDGRNRTYPLGGVYRLYGIAAISFAGLVDGPVLGSIPVAEANTGVSRYVEIALGSEGAAFLEARRGGVALLGGENRSLSEIFGYGTGIPAAELALTLAVPVVQVAEPGALGLLGLGLTALAGLRRSRPGYVRGVPAG